LTFWRGANLDMNPVLSPHTVAVVGSGTFEHDDHSNLVGALLAELEVNLLTGGGRGVMTSVSRAFVRHRRGPGVSIGVLPCASETNRAAPREGYPNVFIELALFTHLPYSGARGTDDLSRNHINVLSAAAIVGLPGEAGTASELALAVRYGKPAIVFALRDELVERFPRTLPRTDRIEEVGRFLRAQLHWAPDRRDG
jgi:uncharacterized protein (TIGR00725 family)